MCGICKYTVTECPMHAGTEVRIQTLQKVSVFDPTIDMQMAQARVKSGQGGLLEIFNDRLSAGPLCHARFRDFEQVSLTTIIQIPKSETENFIVYRII